MNRMMWMMVVLAGCAEAVAPEREASYQREVQGGGLHWAAIEGVVDGQVEMNRLLATATPLRDVIGGLDGDDFVTSTDGEIGAPLVTVFGRQLLHGVPVENAYLYLAVRPADQHEPAQLVSSSYHLYQGAEQGAEPSIGRDDAQALARAALRAAGGVADAELLMVPQGGELRLVWDVTITGETRRARVTARGEEVGWTEVVDDRRFDSSGRVAAWISVDGAPGGAGTPRSVALPDTLVRAGTATAYTDGGGAFTIRGAASMVGVGTSGRAAVVSSDRWSALTAVASGPNFAELVLGSAAASESALAQTTAYYYATRARQWLISSGLSAAKLGAPVDVTVDVDDTCNAFYSPSDRSLSFFRSGGGCGNSAEASLVIHEYGHFVDHTFGGITDSGLSEGWGDVLSCLVRGDPVIGADLYPRGEILRTCDNDYQYPRSGEDDEHALGQAWSGFVWHAREGLIEALGFEAGDAMIRSLVVPVLRANAPDVPSAVREVFLRDDNDRDLSNYTPHWDLLRSAARRHGLDFATDRDHEAPTAVVDLVATATRATRVSLRWTATGDDGLHGTAARYQLRWSTRPITDATFATATPVPAPSPALAGTQREATMVIPPVGRIYVALRCYDEMGNASGLSNVAVADLPPPKIVFGEPAEDGSVVPRGWLATGLWHISARRAGGGSRGFWYGREASGSYDTGRANRGTLTSPIIDLSAVVAPSLVWLELALVESDPAWDRLTIEVVDADDPSVAVTASKVTAGGKPGFVPRLLDLHDLAGRSVRIRFTFDTGDAVRNTLEGWFIDEIRVIGESPPSPPSPPSPSGGGLLVNEILADPPSGFDVDGDGAWSSRGDEMIELINTGAISIALGGATVADSEAVRVTLPAGLVLRPGGVVVITGGAAPVISGVQTLGSLGLYLNNSGDTITVRGADGAVLATKDYAAEGGRDQSLTRRVDGDATAGMVGHRAISSEPASPGRRTDGRSF